MHELYPLSSPKRIHFAYLSKDIRIKKGRHFMKKTFKVLVFTCLHICTLYTQNLGLVIHPVADLIGQPVAKTGRTYANLPVAGSAEMCPRMHQLLFNETVEILKESGDEYYVRVPNLFYVTAQNNKQHNLYWTDKKAILPYNCLNNNPNNNFIPKPIDFLNKHKEIQPIVTLSKPFYNKVFNVTFSAGTRFVAHPPHTRFAYTVSAWHPQQQTIITIQIPKSHAVLQCERTPDEARSLFIELLKTWAHTKGFIPYVWGGCSFTYTHPAKSALNKQTTGTNIIYTVQGDNNTQKHGFDCAGLIARAAQAAGIPYYYKNTATLATYLKPVKTLCDLKEGDLIWIPGHVMAVANLQKNSLIEARHYSQGYGKVHEIALNKIFKGINTYKDLFYAIELGSTLERLDAKAHVAQTITQIKILSLIS